MSDIDSHIFGLLVKLDFKLLFFIFVQKWNKKKITRAYKLVLLFLQIRFAIAIRKRTTKSNTGNSINEISTGDFKIKLLQVLILFLKSCGYIFVALGPDNCR